MVEFFKLSTTSFIPVSLRLSTKSLATYVYVEHSFVYFRAASPSCTYWIHQLIVKQKAPLDQTDDVHACRWESTKAYCSKCICRGICIHGQTYGGEVRDEQFEINPVSIHTAPKCKAGMHAWGGAKRGQGPAACRVLVTPLNAARFQSGALQNAECCAAATPLSLLTLMMIALNLPTHLFTFASLSIASFSCRQHTEESQNRKACRNKGWNF